MLREENISNVVVQCVGATAETLLSFLLALLRGPSVLVVESAGALIPFNLRMIQDNCNRI